MNNNYIARPPPDTGRGIPRRVASPGYPEGGGWWGAVRRGPRSGPPNTAHVHVSGKPPYRVKVMHTRGSPTQPARGRIRGAGRVLTQITMLVSRGREAFHVSSGVGPRWRKTRQQPELQKPGTCTRLECPSTEGPAGQLRNSRSERRFEKAHSRNGMYEAGI